MKFLGKVFKQKPVSKARDQALVDNENAELSAVSAKLAELIAIETAAKAAAERARADIEAYRVSLKSTLESHLADIEQLYGATGE